MPGVLEIPDRTSRARVGSWSAERMEEVAGEVRARLPADIHGTTIVARGSSDHAATYGRYLPETVTGLPVSLAAPSLHALYGIDVDNRGQFVVAVSQSGRTPEIVTTLRLLPEAGGCGLAITNDPTSELAAAAQAVIEPAARAAPKIKETCSPLADGYSSSVPGSSRTRSPWRSDLIPTAPTVSRRSPGGDHRRRERGLRARGEGTEHAPA